MKYRVLKLQQLLMVISASIFLGGCASKDATTKVSEKPPKVIIQTVARNSVRETLTYSGTLQSENITQLGFSVTGKVTEVNVQEGQHVAEGQLLGQVDAADYENALSIANAAYEQAEDNYKRSETAHESGGLTDRDLVVIRTTKDQAYANKKLAEKRLSDTHLKAPFSGVISAKLIERGATVAPGLVAFTIEKTDFLYAKASVPESEISKLQAGETALVTISNMQDTIRGTVSTINPQADANSRTFEVKVRIPNDGGKLLPGMIAGIQIATGKETQALTIPCGSVVRDADDLTYVFVVTGNNKAVLKRIKVDRLSDNGIVVSAGLHEGDTIVAEGQNNLKDGQVVFVN